MSDMMKAGRFAAHRAGAAAVLVAGNGHVRQDYGVPQLIRAVQPTARAVSVGLVPIGPQHGWETRPYSHLWMVDPTQFQRACGDGTTR